tara:strand:- start:6314 stop:6754 length:441 start_codon:yes stop_codon:yes gene_type:complete
MNMQQIIDEWDKDSPIDKYDLDTEAANIPSLHNKYMKIWNTARVAYIKQTFDNKKFFALRRRFYFGELDQEELEDMEWEYDGRLKATKSSIDKYMDNDDEVIRRQEKIEYQEQKLKFIEGIIKSINNRSYAIGHAIAFQRFTQGTG